MLSKIQASVLLFVGTAFAAFQIWNVVSPIDQALVETLVNVIFSILAVLWPAKKVVDAVSRNIDSAKDLKVN